MRTSTDDLLLDAAGAIPTGELAAAKVPPPTIARIALLGLLGVALIADIALPVPARSLVILIAILFVPGALVVLRLRVVALENIAAFVALAVTVSLGVNILLGLIMVWTEFWHPNLAGAVVGMLCFADIGLELARGAERRALRLFDSVIREKAKSLTRGTSPAVHVARRAQLSPAVLTACAFLGLSVILWAISLTEIHVYQLGSYGLPPALNAEWYTALAIVLLGSIGMIWARGFSGWLICGYLAVAALIIFGTIPTLSDVPQYAWSYKHVGVASYIQVHGMTQPSHDIYQRWPGFFSLVAWLSSLSGASILSFARWNELFFTFLDMLLVAALASAISKDRRVWTGAALLFLITNWVGQNYFSPQCIAYSLDLAVLFIVIGRSVGVAARPPLLLRAIDALTAGRVHGLPIAESSVWTPGAVAIALLLDLTMIATHQLTPYILVVQLVALALFGAIRPRYIVAIAAGLAVAYLLPNVSFVLKHYGLINGLNPLDNAQVTAGLAEHRSFVAAHIGGVLSYIAAVLALISFIRLLMCKRDVGTVLVAAALLVSPFAILFASNYGGEASLRIFLFSSPWRDIIISAAIATLSRKAAVVAATCAVLVIAPIFLYSSFDSAATNIFPATEVQASSYFYAHADARSELMLAGKDFPTWMGSRYLEMNGQLGDATPDLLDEPAFQHRVPTPADLGIIMRLLRAASPHPFIVFSTTEELYARDFGPGSQSEIEELERAVAHSGSFRLWYGNKDTRIYELEPA